MTHSPEPWELRDGLVVGTHGSQVVCVDGNTVNGIIVQGCDDPYPPCSEDDMRRIILCVNALADVPDEAIPAIKPMLAEIINAPMRITISDPNLATAAKVLSIWLNSRKSTPGPASPPPPPSAPSSQCTDPSPPS